MKEIGFGTNTYTEDAPPDICQALLAPCVLQPRTAYTVEVRVLFANRPVIQYTGLPTLRRAELLYRRLRRLKARQIIVYRDNKPLAISRPKDFRRVKAEARAESMGVGFNRHFCDQTETRKKGRSKKSPEDKLSDIIATVEQHINRGAKLFVVVNPDGDDHYYKTELGAKRATRRKQRVYNRQGRLLRVKTVYPDIREIDLRHILGWLKHYKNPFFALNYSPRYPYGWLQKIDKLFCTDSDLLRQDVEDY